MPRAPSLAQRPRSTIGPGLARSPNSSHCTARHDCGLAVASGSPGRPCHHPGPTKGRQPNTGITTNLEQISDDVAAGGTQAVLEHRGGQCGQRVGATTVKLQGWRAPAVSPGHVSRGLQRPQEPPWPGDWGLGAGGGPLLGENQAEGPTPPHPSIQLRCTPAGLAHLVPAREPQKSPSPREWGCQAPVPLPLQAEVTSRGQNLQPGPLPWYPGSLDAHRPPSPTTSAPSPAAPSHGRSSPRPWHCWLRRPLWPAARPGHRTASRPWRSGEGGAHSTGGLSPQRRAFTWLSWKVRTDPPPEAGGGGLCLPLGHRAPSSRKPSVASYPKSPPREAPPGRAPALPTSTPAPPPANDSLGPC